MFRTGTKENNIANLYHGFGSFNPDVDNKGYRIPSFQIGDSITMGTNPSIVNLRRFNIKKQTTEAIWLNGMAVFFKEGTQKNEMQIEVTYAYPHIYQDVYWTGNIILPNITRDETADIILARKQKITIQKSQTAMCSKIQEDGSFSKASSFKIKSGAVLLLKRRAQLKITEGSQLIVEKEVKLY